MARPKKTPKENICKNCDGIFYTRPSHGRDFCSKPCAQQWKGKDKSWLEKRKKTCLDKYGVEVAILSEEVRNKYKHSLREKYGVESPFESKEIRNKASEKIKDRYGVEFASQHKDIANKISNKLKNRIINRENFVEIKWDKLIAYFNETGMEPMFDKQYLIENKIKHQYKNKFVFKCNKCNNTTEVFLSNGYLPSCLCCTEFKGYSLIEDEILNFLLHYIERHNIKLNDRNVLKGKELDIFLEEYNIAVEVNGVYWHSESLGKYKNYHLFKTNKCLEKGIRLIHILDYEWLFKKPIIQSILLSQLNLIENKIYARKCVIKPIPKEQLRPFLNENHIQGYTHSSVNLGLYYKDELVSIMTFGKNRFKKNSNEFELVRFCNKLNTNVIGGASKLFKYFLKNYNKENNDIISFSDRRFFDGGLYPILGFEFESYTSPSYIYWKDNRILNRMSCQKHKLHKLLDNFNSELSEYENMKMNGYRRVWDCGNTKWRLKKPSL